MKDRAKILTIISGIITVLLGIFTCVISVFVLLGAVSESDPLMMLATLGMLLVLQILLFIFALGVGIFIITMGALQIKLGSLSNYEYSLRKGSVIGFSCFDAIILIIVSIICAIFPTSGVFASCGAIGGVLLLCFTFKILDYALFKKKTNKGLISIEKPKPAIDFSNLNLNKKDHQKELEKLNKLKEDNLITEEEYKNLRQKLLDDITK